MIDPFLKWPGGKRWLIRQYQPLFPPDYQRYIEPFLGSGAVFFCLNPRRAILSDSNADLINAFQCLKKHSETIGDRLAEFQRKHSESFYYRVRSTRPTDRIDQAVQFLYLNRTCFNGIYRVNRAGEFNVPIGTKSQVEYPVDYLRTVAAYLRRASIRGSDFENTINCAGRGDFVFVDPPYTVMHNDNGFVKYNAKLFSWEDQLRLAFAVKRAAHRGAAIMMCNADHHSVRELYRNFGIQRSVRRSSVLAADPIYRRESTELLITTYETSGDMKSSRVSHERTAVHHAISDS